MRKLIKLDRVYDIKFASKIFSFMDPDRIYVPIEEGYELIKKQNSKVLKNEAILENKLKKIKSSISGKIIGTTNLICDGALKECIVIENNYEENTKEIKNKIKGVTTEDIISILTSLNFDDYLNIIRTRKISNIVVNGLEDEPYIENNPYILQFYANEILKMTDAFSDTFKIENSYIAIKSNDTENINLFLSKIGTYTNINLSLIEDKYLLGTNFFLLENMGLSENSLVISAKDMLSIYNGLVYSDFKDNTFITIASPYLEKGYVVNVKIGTLLSDVFQKLNIDIKDALYIYNGLMTGCEIDYKKCVITNNTKAVLIIPNENEEVKKCNLCGMCYKICPVKVNPKNVMDTGKKSKNCIDCGLCTYICPCKINLRKYLRGQK